MANPPDYELPKEIDRNRLIKSSVIITNGEALGTGVAISKRHILTAAHALCGHFLDQLPIDVAGLNVVKNRYLVPATETPANNNDQPILKAEFSRSPDTKPLKIKSIHLHPKATFKRAKDEDENTEIRGFEGLQERLNFAIGYGLKVTDQYATNGVRGEYKIVDAQGSVTVHMARVFGPDLAIIECSEDHGLPFLEIASPLPDDKTLIHILGLTGLRYENNDSTNPIAGAFFPYEEKIVFSCIPAIYGQRFQPFQTEDGQTGFINRVFMKKIADKSFLMDDQVYPGAPKGFGLLAAGDSGAGAIVVKDGKPYLAGIARSGDVPATFLLIQDIISQAPADKQKALEAYGKDFLVKVQTIYNDALKEESREKKWFIAQCLSDVTHEKEWITKIIGTSEK